MQTLILKTAPVNPLFTLDQIKAHLCITDDLTETDAQITDLGDAVESYLDGNDGVLNRGLITQSWTLIRTGLRALMSLPLPPLQSVDEIRYLDNQGVQQILSASLYRVVYTGAVNRRAIIVIADNETYPSTDSQIGNVEIDFTCGYGDSWNDIPPNARQLALLLLASFYELRETEIVGTIVADNPSFTRAMSAARYHEATP